MRAAMVGMRVLPLVSVLIIIPGLGGTKLVDSALARARLLQVSGALCLCGGACGAAGLLWYGVDTYTRYILEVTLGVLAITFEFGLSYWLMVEIVFCSFTSAVLTNRSAFHIYDASWTQPRLAPGQEARTNTRVSQQSTSNCKTYI